MPSNATFFDLRALKVAVVDDDAAVRSGISRLARSHGFSCSTFESGEQALTSISLELADCLILDVQLSESMVSKPLIAWTLKGSIFR